MSKLSDFLKTVEDVAILIEGDAYKLLKGIIHLVELGAPIAEVVGTAIGQPEVTAGAATAEAAAKAADHVIQANEQKE